MFGDMPSPPPTTGVGTVFGDMPSPPSSNGGNTGLVIPSSITTLISDIITPPPPTATSTLPAHTGGDMPQPEYDSNFGTLIANAAMGAILGNAGDDTGTQVTPAGLFGGGQQQQQASGGINPMIMVLGLVVVAGGIALVATR